MQWRRILVRAGIAVAGLVAALIVALVGIILFDAQFGPKTADLINIRVPGPDGVELGGYLARPPGAGPHPAVLMIHEWWGLTEEITVLADRLAADGFVVLALDTYRGKTTHQVPRALYLRLTVPLERVDLDVFAGFDYLAGLPEVRKDRIGVMGFCYGGGIALRHGVQNPAVAATINLYGTVVTDPSGLGVLGPKSGPVLGIFGDQDAQFPAEEISKFETALTQGNVAHTVTVYPGVGHAFVQPALIDQPGAARDAWVQIQQFLSKALR